MKLKSFYTFKEWNEKIMPRVGKDIKDISNQLCNSFLLYGQVMRALLLYGNKRYYISAWNNGKVFISSFAKNHGACLHG